MSTPEDRLRKSAEAAKREHEAREREQQPQRIQQEESLRARQTRVHSFSQMFLSRAETLARATGTAIRIWLENEREGGDPGFRLSISRQYRIRGALGESGWRVTIHGPSSQSQMSYANDDDFRKDWDTLLEPVIEKAVQAVIRGEESPY